MNPINTSLASASRSPRVPRSPRATRSQGYSSMASSPLPSHRAYTPSARTDTDNSRNEQKSGNGHIDKSDSKNSQQNQKSKDEKTDKDTTKTKKSKKCTIM